MNRFAFAAVAVALLTVPAMAIAKDAQMRLDLSGVNPRTAEGASEALSRINKAATVACELNATGTRVSRQDKSCIADLVRQAVDAIASRELSALHKADPTHMAGQAQPGGLDAADPTNGRMKGVR